MDSSFRHTIFLSALAGLLFFFGLGSRDFWAPVEPRYGEIVRVMFISGEWIVPTVNGDLYTDKPILYFWLALLASKIFGSVSEWTVRWPAALGGVGFVVTTYFIGRDFFSARVGLFASIILATSMRVIWESRWAHLDALFCFFFALTIYFGARALLRKGGPHEVLLAYVFMALAVLTKGLIGVVLPGLLFAAFVLAQRDWRLIGAAKLPLGIGTFLLVAAPWFYLVSQETGGRWLSDFIYIHHVRRYTAGAGHREPFYYYLTTLPVDFLPWTVFAIPALAAYRSYRRIWTDPVKRFFILWFLVVLVFFSLSDTKRDLYLMPLLPVLALLVANYLVDLENGRVPHGPLYRWVAVFFFAVVALAGLAAPFAAWLVRNEVVLLLVPSAVVLVGAALLAIYFIRHRRPFAVVKAVAGMMALGILSAAVTIFPYLERFKSHRAFAYEIKKIVPPTAPLFVYADTMNDFNYYTGRLSIPVISSPRQLDALVGGAGGYILVKERDLGALPHLSREWIVASESLGSATWHLIKFKRDAGTQSANERKS